VTERERFLRFLMAGGIAAGVNVLSRIVFNTTMPYEAAIPLAYLVAMVVAFTLNRAMVFAPTGRTLRDEGIRFAVVNAVAAAQVWIVSVVLARALFPAVGFEWNADTVAHVIGVASPVFTSYLGHKHISFRARQ
jgi:putative flippase GtrA